jgi:hypothetical protein
MCTPRPGLLALVIAGVIGACGGEALTLPSAVRGPAALTAVSGYDQEGTVGSKLDRPLVAKVTDSESAPLRGVVIVFRFQSDVPGAQVDPEAVTNDEGVASAEVTLGESTGSQIVEAQVARASGPHLSATFPLTAVEDEKGKKDKRGGHGDDEEDDDDEDDDDDD